MAQHWTGTRSGWNQRGGTDREILAASQRYQRRKAEDALRAAAGELIELVGEDAYQRWIEDNISDDDRLDQITAKIYAYIQIIKNPDLRNNLVEG